MECEIEECDISSPIGKMFIRACSTGLHHVAQYDETSVGDLFQPDVNRPVELLSGTKNKIDQSVIKETIQWLQSYFDKLILKKASLVLTDLPSICSNSIPSSFRYESCVVLAKNVRFGELISYGKLAKLIGKPKASRAVGIAVSNNPIQILVPCHRVIKSDGTLGNYAKGRKNDVKK